MPQTALSDMQPANPDTRPRRRLRQAGLLLWAVMAFVITGSLASAHEYTLPHPPRTDPVLLSALNAQRTPGEVGRFGVTHIMYAACNCSKSIIDHLAARGARKDVAEHVVLVGQDEQLARRIERAGFQLENIEPLELKRKYAIEAAPLLIIAEPDGAVAYMGGYTTRKQGLDIRDTALIDAALAGKRGNGLRELPLLGCAVSRALQRMLDPFALKY